MTVLSKSSSKNNLGFVLVLIAALVLTPVGSAVILEQPVSNLEARGVFFAIAAALFKCWMGY